MVVTLISIKGDVSQYKDGVAYFCDIYPSPGASKPKSAVPIPKPGEWGYEWPSIVQQLNHLREIHGGDHDEVLKEVLIAFEVIFPGVVVTAEKVSGYPGC